MSTDPFNESAGEPFLIGQAVPPGEEGYKVLGFLLIEAVKARQPWCAAELIKAGADVNVQDEFGMSPLHYAVGIGDRPCIRVLVASGKCNYLLQANGGITASYLAIHRTHDRAVARLLGKHVYKTVFQATEVALNQCMRSSPQSSEPSPKP